MTEHLYAIARIAVDEMADLEKMPFPPGMNPKFYSVGQFGVVKFWPPIPAQMLALYWKEP